MGVEINRAVGLQVDFATQILRKYRVAVCIVYLPAKVVRLVYAMSSTVPILLKSALWVLIIKIRRGICAQVFL